jgi:hypothetical protein
VNRRIRDPYVRWCERCTGSGLSGVSRLLDYHFVAFLLINLAFALIPTYSVNSFTISLVGILSINIYGIHPVSCAMGQELGETLFCCYRWHYRSRERLSYSQQFHCPNYHHELHDHNLILDPSDWILCY